MFTAKDYYDLTRNSRRAIAKLADFYCPADCKRCPFYCDGSITVRYVIDGKAHSYEGHCAVNAARVEFPNWRYE